MTSLSLESPGAPRLILVPTDVELRHLEDCGGFGPGRALVEVCGFGPVASAARAAERLARLRPRHVFLVGIAGSFDPARHPVGSALTFSRVALDGVGAGEGEELLGPERLGLAQWRSPSDASRPAIVEELPVHPRDGDAALLLTVCSASDSEGMAAVRRRRHPEAVAEDMEGFAVALACSLADVPLTIVRGISNRVGDRHTKTWRVGDAMAAARVLALDLLERDLRSAER